MTTKNKQSETKQREPGHGGEKQPAKPAEKQSAGKHAETTAKHGETAKHETTAKHGEAAKHGDTKHGEAAKHGDTKHSDTGAKAGERAGKHDEPTGKHAAPTDKHRSQQESGSTRGNQVEGEGSYTATQRYDEGVRKSVEQGGIEKGAEEASRALDGPEGQMLREAEEAAKQGKSMPQQPHH